MNHVLLTSLLPDFECSTVIEIYLPSGIYTRIQIILNVLLISNVGQQIITLLIISQYAHL